MKAPAPIYDVATAMTVGAARSAAEEDTFFTQLILPAAAEPLNRFKTFGLHFLCCAYK